MSADASLAAIHTTKTKSKHLTHKQYRYELKAALDGFQKTREWADLIQNLSKLHKVFIKFKHIHDEFNEAVESSPSIDAYRHRVLPHTVQICKVLAMCLTPGRPAGVHLKAIEVYQAVFQNLSRQNLIADLGLWLCGLLPLASFASTRVRPILLKLLKEYIISLGEPCRVALDGIITSLLPCIEEQNTPLYFQAVELLNELAQNTGLPFFFSAIMRTICSCSHVRISATHYLNLLFKDHSMRDECIELCKSNETLCIQAWLCVLRDSENVLAKRNILDLLNAYFPLNESLLNKLEPHQILLLVHGLLPVMLFREVSVNRRIYSWLLNITTNDIDPSTATNTSTTITQKIDISLSVSSMDRSDDMNDSNNVSDDVLSDNNNNNNNINHLSPRKTANISNSGLSATMDEDEIPRLSEFSENIIADAFRLYLDRTGDINFVELNTIPPLTAYPSNNIYNMNINQSPLTSARSIRSYQSDHSLNMESPRSISRRSTVHSHNSSNNNLPIPGLAIFKKLTYFDNNDDNINAEQYITSPLNLLKILIDRNEIRSSKLIQRLHSKILQYAYSFEPNSMSDPTNLETITCFQAVIQATQLIYAQIDTHHTIQWLRTMIQSKYTEFIQLTAPTITNNDNNNNNNNKPELHTQFTMDVLMINNNNNDNGYDPDKDNIDDNDQNNNNNNNLSEISPTKRKYKQQHLSIDIPRNNDNIRFSSFIHQHWIHHKYDSCNLTLMKAIELIDFALDFIPIVSHRDEIMDSIAHLEESIDPQQESYRERKYSTVDKDVAALVGDVLSKLHTLLIGDTRIQGIRFCLKLFQRLGKKAINIPNIDIITYLSNSIPMVPSLENIQKHVIDKNGDNNNNINTPSNGLRVNAMSPRTEMHNRLELEVIELNFQLLQIVIEAQDIGTITIEKKEDNDDDGNGDHDAMRDKLIGVIIDHLQFAERCVYLCKSEQLVLCGAQIWLKLINSFSFLPKHDTSCKKITARLWELIEPSKSSAINYQIAKLLIMLADINYICVEKVISQRIVSLQNTLQHNLMLLAEGYQRFCTLYRIIGEIDALKFYWNELVYIMLAACSDDRPLIHNIATQWLTESLSIPPRVLDPMIIELLESSTQTNPIGPEIYQYHQWYDPRLASDILKKLLSIVISMGPKLISSCKNCGLTTNIVDKLLLHGCQLSADHLQTHLQSVLEQNKNNNNGMHKKSNVGRRSSISSNHSAEHNKHGHGHNNNKKKRIELRVNRTSCLYLPEFQCRDYLDVLVLIGLKYIRGNVDSKMSADIKNSSLRVRTIAIEFLRRLFQQFGHNLRSAKLAAGITSTIVHQLSIAIQSKQYLLQIELLSLLSTLITVTYRRVNPKECETKINRKVHEYINKKKSQQQQQEKGMNDDNNNNKDETPTNSSQMLFISEPDIFSSPFFTNTIISGIGQSCKLRLEDMQIQLYPLKHFLRFCTFSCDYIKKGLSYFITNLFNVLCEEISNNNNIQHMKHLLDGAGVLLRKLIRNPNESVQVNEDTDFNAGTWMVHILTFGLATAARKSTMNNHKISESDENNMERPSFLIDAEMKLFRSWPVIMHSLCVAWGRTLSANSFFDDHNRNSNNSSDGTGSSMNAGKRRNSLFNINLTASHSTSSRRHREELDELHIRLIQEQIIDLILPFFIRHNSLVFVAVLNNWEKELNIGKVWALEMQSNKDNMNHYINKGEIILNYGEHIVLSRECQQHKNVLNLLNRLNDDVPATVVLHSICDIAIANINKSEIRGTSMLVRMNECTPLHFMYYYIHTLLTSECIVTIWYSIRKYFDQILNNSSSSHPITYLWILSILQKIIEKTGNILMNDKQRKKSFITITKLICTKIADIAGHPDKYENNDNNNNNNNISKHDPMCLPPILFFMPSRQHHSNDFPPLPDWIQQLLIPTTIRNNADNITNITSPRPLTPQPPPLSTAHSFESDLFGLLNDSASKTQENLSQKVHNSHIPRVYSSPTLGVSLASIRVLANMLASFLHCVFKKDWNSNDVINDNNNNNDDISADKTNKIHASYDTDSINNVLYSVITNLSNILTLPNKIENVNKKQDDNNSLMTNLSFLNGYASILSSLSIQQYRSHTYRCYIRDAWNYFMSSSFFNYCDISTLHHWQWIIGSVIECDKSKLKYELLNNPTNTISSVFAKHETEVEIRRKQLKRLAFVIHAGRRDQYGRYLNTILEKLVESLKIPNATTLYSQVFVCLRVLLTRIDVTNLSPIWPLIITETIRAFEKSSDKDLLLNVCKFVDTALILLPQTFQLFKWSFIQDSSTQELLRRHSSHSSHSHSLSKSKSYINNTTESTVFIPHLQLLAKRLEEERKEKQKKERKEEKEEKEKEIKEEKEETTQCRSGIFGNGLSNNNNMKRPILLMRKIQNVYELIPFHRIVSSLHQRQSQTIDVDYKFLNDLIRSDFIQSNLTINPLLQDIREPSPF